MTASDIQAHATGGSAPAPAPAPAPVASQPAPVAPAPTAAPEPDNAAPMSLATTRVAIAPEGTVEKIPFHGIRRKIAQSLHHSVQTTVHFTVVDEADITTLEQKRAGFESLLGNRLSLLPFIMTAVCAALKKHPTLNANVDDFMEEIHIKGPVNLGCAVDTDHGLMVPVIHAAQDLTFVQMSERVRELAMACRNRSVPRESLAGGTFTISNVGSAGGMFATPIINYPEVAILAVGRAKETVLTRNGAFYAGLVLPLSLSCDHRVVDGAEGARFLNTLVGLLEDLKTASRSLIMAQWKSTPMRAGSFRLDGGSKFGVVPKAVVRPCLQTRTTAYPFRPMPAPRDGWQPGAHRNRKRFEMGAQGKSHLWHGGTDNP